MRVVLRLRVRVSLSKHEGDDEGGIKVEGGDDGESKHEGDDEGGIKVEGDSGNQSKHEGDDETGIK